MSTQHDIEKEQGVRPSAPPSLHTTKSGQEAGVSPVQTFSQPLRRPPRPPRNRWVVISAVILALALMLSLGVFLIPGLIQHSASPATPTATSPAATVPTTPGIDVTSTPAAGVTMGPQAGPTGVSDPAYWDKIIGTRQGVNKVESVSFASIMDTPSLQALVTVRYTGTDAQLDVYVFNNITSTHPKQVFKLAGLVKGDAKISGYNTVMTAEVDKNSSINKGKSVSAMKQDLFREFDWSNEEGTLVQTAFPGLYPDLTRYQAEADQARVNQGQDSWKNDPTKVAKALASQFFGWKRALTTKVLSGGGPHDVAASVQVQESPVQGGPGQGPTVTVKLSRLEGNTHNIWEAIAVEDGPGALTNITARSLIASPVKLEGKGGAFEGTIGMAYILDHQYTTVGRAIVTDHGMSNSPYSISVTYDTGFKQGPQEGIVEVQMTSPVEADPYSAVMVKVLLDPKPVVALGPVSCPLALQQPKYWETNFGISPGTVSCANLKGDPSLQAVVPVLPSAGKPGYIYVYDHITDAHPVQLFSLQADSTMISGYSTILTANVDQNSSINKGKSEDQMTIDLFREFQWSSKEGTFVQVAFPGIFPDLTRWEAERDQIMVTLGQDNWKNNAAKVAQNMAVKLLKWSANTQTKVLSGGGPRDVDAVVQVQSTGPDHPTIKVTLSRLEGNTNNIWEVIAVADGSLMSITSPHKWDRLTSPVTVKGTGGAFEGDVGTVFVLDHLYNDIGHAKGIPANNGKTTFTATVPYTATFHGIQEGVLTYYTYSQADGAIAGVVMLKVLIRA